MLPPFHMRHTASGALTLLPGHQEGHPEGHQLLEQLPKLGIPELCTEILKIVHFAGYVQIMFTLFFMLIFETEKYCN